MRAIGRTVGSSPARAAAPETSPASWSIPRSSPTAWCEVVGPRTNASTWPSSATSAMSVLELPPSTARTAAVIRCRRPGCPSAGRRAGRRSRTSRPRRRGAGRSRAGRRASGPARCGAGRRPRRLRRAAPSTTLETSAVHRASRLPVVRGDVPADVARVAQVRERGRGARVAAPAPNGARNHGRGSTPDVLADGRLGVGDVGREARVGEAAATGRGRTSGSRRGGRRPRSAAPSPARPRPSGPG